VAKLMTRDGLAAKQARTMATAVVGAFRRLQLDLLFTRDRKRIDAAAESLITLDQHASERQLRGPLRRAGHLIAAVRGAGDVEDGLRDQPGVVVHWHVTDAWEEDRLGGREEFQKGPDVTFEREEPVGFGPADDDWAVDLVLAWRERAVAAQGRQKVEEHGAAASVLYRLMDLLDVDVVGTGDEVVQQDPA
jgi:hypothetical protein